MGISSGGGGGPCPGPWRISEGESTADAETTPDRLTTTAAQTETITITGISNAPVQTLTTADDTVVTPPSGATVYATAATLNAGDSLTGGGGSDNFVFQLGKGGGDTVTDFTSGTDHLDFFGYGTGATGATLSEVGATDFYTITPDAAHGGAAAAETIHVANVFALTASDYLLH